jgi:hypothetical protein
MKGSAMSVQVKYKNGYIGVASEKAAAVMEASGEAEIVSSDKQPELIPVAPKRERKVKAAE